MRSTALVQGACRPDRSELCPDNLAYGADQLPVPRQQPPGAQHVRGRPAATALAKIVTAVHLPAVGQRIVFPHVGAEVTSPPSPKQNAPWKPSLDSRSRASISKRCDTWHPASE